MDKPNKNNTAGNGTKPEPDSDANGNQTSFGSEMKHIFDHIMTGSGLGAIVVLLVGIALAYLFEGTFANKRLWWGYISLAGIGNILLFCAFYAWDRTNSTTPTTSLTSLPISYTIEAKLIIANMNGPPELSSFWTVSDARMGLTRYPIVAAILAEWTNCGTTECVIESYCIETRCDTGNWEKVPCFTGPMLGDIYAGANLASMNQISYFPELFHEMVANKTIKPGEKIRGWMLLSTTSRGIREEFRMRTRSTTGGESLQEIPPLYNARPNPTNTDYPGGYKIVKVGIDLSHIPMDIYLG